MTPPICRLCHVAHWPREGCKHIATARCPSCAMWEAEGLRLTAEVAALRNQSVTTPGVVTKRVTKRNRAEYMREYRARHG